MKEQMYVHTYVFTLVSVHWREEAREHLFLQLDLQMFSEAVYGKCRYERID